MHAFMGAALRFCS